MCVDPEALRDLVPEVPVGRIATAPVQPRDRALLLRLDRHTGACRDHVVRDLPELLEPGDLLVLNDTRVVAARLEGQRATGGRVELLCVPPPRPDARTCSALAACRGRLEVGEELTCAAGKVRWRVETFPDPGRVELRLLDPEELTLLEVLETHGTTPLPPYIDRARRARGQGSLPDEAHRYQTIYAEHPGAVAAPTAGLHFTAELLAALEARGVCLTRLTLHVGPGTFLPVRCQDPRNHRMEAEAAHISTACVEAIDATRARGGRVVATGTTCVRALESAADVGGGLTAGPVEAGIYIHPPHRFRVVDGLLTNFHLPDSTPCLLVAALLDDPGHLRQAYEHALAGAYRFYSYGDAMLVLGDCSGST